jgi:hypothetical protein
MKYFSTHLVIVCVDLVLRTYEMHLDLPLNLGVTKSLQLNPGAGPLWMVPNTWVCYPDLRPKEVPCV